MWRDLRAAVARKGKEREGSGGKHEWTRAERSVEETVSDRGENRPQGRGRKRRTRRGGKRPWREKMSEVGRTGRKEGEGSGARRRGTRGPGGVYPGKPGPRGPGDTRTLRSMQGRKLPHVRKPLLLPPVIGPDILSRWLRSVSKSLGSLFTWPNHVFGPDP